MTLEGKYNIKAVTKMLDIQPGTLRAWERRYKIIHPLRNQAGHRLYTENQVAILSWLVNKVKQGFTISQAVELLESQEQDFTLQELQAEDRLSQLKNELMGALLSFEENKSNQLIDQAFSMYSVEKVIIHLLGELLKDVGNKWEQGEITVAHEHYISSFMRTKIGMVLHHLPVQSWMPKVICVCAPGEIHEIGLLIFTYFLKRCGFETIYLGQGLPEEDILAVVKEIKPSIVFVSCTISKHLPTATRLIPKLEKFGELRVGIGGQAVQFLSETEKKLL